MAGLDMDSQLQPQYKKPDRPYDGFMEDYPILFKNNILPMTQTAMCWGIECPAGWKGILTDLCDKLEFLNNTVGKELGLEICAEQVKEKFGTLRFYITCLPAVKEPVGEADTIQPDGSEEETDRYHTAVRENLLLDIAEDVVSHAEFMSGEICQTCGKPVFGEDKKVSSGWIGYYCPECFAKHQQEIEYRRAVKWGKAT